MHGSLSDENVGAILKSCSTPADAARMLVTSALSRGSADNCTALVLDVIELPAVQPVQLAAAVAMEIELGQGRAR